MYFPVFFLTLVATMSLFASAAPIVLPADLVSRTCNDGCKGRTIDDVAVVPAIAVAPLVVDLVDRTCSDGCKERSLPIPEIIPSVDLEDRTCSNGCKARGFNGGSVEA